MPGYDYVGNAMKAGGYLAFQIPSRMAGGVDYSNPAVSTGPYAQSSALGSGYQAANFNLGQSGNLSQISDIINSIQRSAQKSALEARIPNAPALEAKSSANIGTELAGGVPQDVQDLLGQQAAERGVATGVGPTSPNANAAYLRALGLTSLQQEQVGQENLTRAYARNPAAPLFDPSTQLISPYQGALLGMQGQQQNIQTINDLNNANLRAQQLALEQRRYSNPIFNYAPPTTTTGNTLTGADLFSYDQPASPGGGTYTASSDYYNPNLPSTYYDYTAPSTIPTEIGAGGFDYASTPVSMYG